jgi:hypothetical protein
VSDHPADLEALALEYIDNARPMPPMAIRGGKGKWHLPHPNAAGIMRTAFSTDRTDCGRPWAAMTERAVPLSVRTQDRCATCWVGRYGNKVWGAVRSEGQ